MRNKKKKKLQHHHQQQQGPIRIFEVSPSHAYSYKKISLAFLIGLVCVCVCVPSPLQHASVSWDEGRKKWKCEMEMGGRLCNLGLLDSEIEAAETYDRYVV